jgi:hypothetical protein
MCVFTFVVYTAPVLPHPVELVAGGEGRPEWADEAPGLGGAVGRRGLRLRHSGCKFSRGRHFDKKGGQGVIEQEN